MSEHFEVFRDDEERVLARLERAHSREAKLGVDEMRRINFLIFFV
jgi:hypothetical protein